MADRHIADGNARVARLAAHIVRLRELSADTGQAETLLRNFELVLVEWHRHRGLILEALARTP